ncbi:hypothetical protein BDA96_08G170500 [Sorghum bicolor]|uniref:BHLH domain-containing protein n=1 Tax=Sorghum bicolor TaxID=4558 RepID=A0A921U7E6_SORBI|nr:hypothetical protein BDA96_08G170500 [Sorghum bicolor]
MDCGMAQVVGMATTDHDRKKATGGARRSHPAETHNLTEKRRRRKIDDKLKTLRQLVPGCDDKSNQASILDQTIQHIKSLQQQIQVQPKAISLGCDAIKPPAVYPVVLPQGTAVAAAGELLPPAAALPPAVLAMAARGHVRPGLAPLHHLRRWCLSVPFFQW